MNGVAAAAAVGVDTLRMIWFVKCVNAVTASASRRHHHSSVCVYACVFVPKNIIMYTYIHAHICSTKPTSLRVHYDYIVLCSSRKI